MKTSICRDCGKEFKSTKHKNFCCYICELKQKQQPPEVNDIVSARITSGEMTDAEWHDLRLDFKEVCSGEDSCSRCAQLRCVCDPYEVEQEEFLAQHQEEELTPDEYDTLLSKWK